MTQEFGTVPSSLVVIAMARERTLWVLGANSEYQAAGALAHIRASFYIETERWERGVNRRGQKVLTTVLERLGKCESDDDPLI